MSREVGVSAKFHYLGTWRDEEIAGLIRFAEEPSCPFEFAHRLSVEKMEDLSTSEGRIIGPWYYPRVDPNDLRRAQHEFRGGRSTTLFLVRKPSSEGKWTFPSESQVDFQVMVYDDIKLTSIDFGGTYVDRGNDEFLLSGGLDKEVDLSLHLLETLAGWRCPEYGSLGRSGGLIHNTDLLESIKKATLADPRLRWVTVFGPCYVKALGLDFFLRVPGYRIERIRNDGILYQATKDFLVWEEQTPSPEEIESYLRRHPNFKKAKYQPVYAKDILSPKAYNAAMAARSGVPRTATLPARRWHIADVSQIAELVKPAPVLAKEHFGVDLDFSPESLKALDGALKREYTDDEALTDEDIEAVSISLGIYIGEVVRRLVGGEWEISDEPPSPRLVNVPGFHWLDPIGRVEKRLVEGEAASLWDWCQSIKRHSKD